MGKKLEEWGKAILWASIILVVLYFFFWPVRLEGSSMEPTLNDGDMIFMSRHFAQREQYEAGDIVVFDYYENGSGKTVVKRVIATEGQRIQVLPEGTVAVNGKTLAETYTTGSTEGLVDLIVPENTIFVMGDNRGVSYDSRHMGAISQKLVKGKVLFHLPLS